MSNEVGVFYFEYLACFVLFCLCMFLFCLYMFGILLLGGSYCFWGGGKFLGGRR